MRPLTEDETRTLFEKLAKYIGKNIKHLIDRSDATYCFRLHNDRVYYINETLLKEAQNVNHDNLVSIGTCFGKFTKTKKFHLHITSLQYISQYSVYKIWIKPNGEMNYLYGNNVLKNHLGRITDNTPQYSGVTYYSMSDIALGFGIAAYSTQQCRNIDSASIAGFHQTDIGEYLRIEDTQEQDNNNEKSTYKKRRNKTNNSTVDSNETDEIQQRQYKKQKYNNSNNNNNNTKTQPSVNKDKQQFSNNKRR